MSILPLQRLHHTNVVVRDLRAAALNYARLLGIVQWDLHHWTPERIHDAQAFGYRAEFGYSTASGCTSEGLTFRLVQPTHGFSSFTEHLISRGPGVHSICTAVVENPSAGGLPIGQAATFDAGHTSLMIDTRRLLGGFSIEVADAGVAGPDVHWDLSAEVASPPDAAAWLWRLSRIGHFGIAVANVADKLPRYARVLGVERWSGVHFDTASGALEHSTFDGETVQNAWFLALTEVADFGLELLQSTREPTDYGRTIARAGEGIHHVLVRRGLSDPEWEALRTWMAEMRIGVVMSGRVRGGGAEFFYLDTHATLGFLLEVIVTRDAPSVPMPRVVLDFSTRA